MNVFNAWDEDFVHPLATVHAEASIGEESYVWAFASVSIRAVIGKHCTIGQYVHIGPGVRIGSGCKIQSAAQLFEGVTLEDDVFIGPGVVTTNVTVPRAFVNRKAEFKTTLIKHGASIGANATILCGIEIGEYAMIGAGAVVTRNVEPHALYTGVPAAHGGWVCRCGIRLQTPGLLCACGTRLEIKESKLYPYNITSVKVADGQAT